MLSNQMLPLPFNCVKSCAGRCGFFYHKAHDKATSSRSTRVIYMRIYPLFTVWACNVLARGTISQPLFLILNFGFRIRLREVIFIHISHFSVISQIIIAKATGRGMHV